MTTDPTLTLLRAADPLDPAADLNPQGANALRIRTTAVTGSDPFSQSECIKGSDPFSQGGRKKGSDPVARLRRGGVVVVAACALAAVAIAVGLPGDGGGPTAPADARAALLSSAARTAAYTSGHITWRMAYTQPYAVDLTNDVRFQGADVEVAWTTRHHDSTAPGGPSVFSGASRVVDGVRFVRDGDEPYRRSGEDRGDGLDELRVRVDAAGVLATATRAASDVEAAAVDGGTRYTATVPAADVPDVLRPPFRRTTASVTITALTAEDGSLRSLALRAPGERVDIAFEELGRPQEIVAP
jgi:hypothetical protein